MTPTALVACVVLLATAGFGCQRRRAEVTVESLPSGVRFEVPRAARALPASGPTERSYSLPGGDVVLAITEEKMADGCAAHLDWAEEESRRALEAARSSALTTSDGPPRRLEVGGRSALAIAILTRNIGSAYDQIERVDMLGVCARDTFVIFQTVKRGRSEDRALAKLLRETAASLRF
jgi:hypothetical protein